MASSVSVLQTNFPQESNEVNQIKILTLVPGLGAGESLPENNGNGCHSCIYCMYQCKHYKKLQVCC